MRAAGLSTVAWLAVAAASFSERLEFVAQERGKYLAVFSWIAPPGHFASCDADVSISSGRGIQIPALRATHEDSDMFQFPQGTHMDMTASSTSQVADQCAWCSWFEGIVSSLEQRVDHRLWQAAGLRSCMLRCPAWREGEQQQRQAIADRISNSAYVSVRGNVSSVYHPMVLGLDTVRELAFAFSACGGHAGIAALLDQGALASAAWWRVHLQLPGGRAGAPALRVAMLLPGDRPTGPATALGRPGAPPPLEHASLRSCLPPISVKMRRWRPSLWPAAPQAVLARRPAAGRCRQPAC